MATKKVAQTFKTVMEMTVIMIARHDDDDNDNDNSEMNAFELVKLLSWRMVNVMVFWMCAGICIRQTVPSN